MTYLISMLNFVSSQGFESIGKQLLVLENETGYHDFIRRNQRDPFVSILFG